MDKIEALIRGLITEEQYKTIKGNTVRRVRYKGVRSDLRGLLGVVLDKSLGGTSCAVQFDEKNIWMHDADGKGKERHCWYCQEKQLEDVRDEDG